MLKNKLILFIIVCFSFWIILWNYNFITWSVWNYHTDERDTIAWINNLIKNNDLFIKKSTELNNHIWYELFAYWNTCKTECKEKIILKPYGEYYFFSYFKLIVGDSLNLIVIISIINLLWILFIYLLLTRILSLNKNISIYISLLMFIFPTIVFWSNLQYTNSIAFTFFIAWIYFLLKNDKKYHSIYSIIWWVLLWFAIFTRYEYIIILGITFLFSPINIFKNYKIAIIPILIIVFYIWYLNNNYFWWALKLSYTEQIISINNNVKQKDSNIGDQIMWLYNRFFSSDINLDKSRLLHNYNENIYSYLNIFFIFFILWLWLFFYKNNHNIKNRNVIFWLIIWFSYWTYNTLAWYHWWQEFSLNFTVHSRYIYWYYFFILIFSIYFLYKIKVNRIILNFVFILFLTISISNLFNWYWSLYWFAKEKYFSNILNNYVWENDVFLWNVYEKYINNWYVIPYENIEKYWLYKVENDLVKLREVWLIDRIIIMEEKNHITYKNYSDIINRNDLKIIILNRNNLE